MRFIHTADWHLGRRLKGIDRTPEIAFALDALLAQIKTLEIDAVLVAGDIFDMPNPPAEAEKVAYQFFCQLHELQIPAVVITGNHDSPARFEGVAKLLAHVGVQILARPQPSTQGGIITVDTKNGKLCIAAIPFASERRLLRIESQQDRLEQRQHYKDIIMRLLNELSQAFQDNAVNVILAHLTVAGAIRAYSEVNYYTRDTYELSHNFSAEAQYVALGHIHKPQAIAGAVPTYYAGSLIQVDFGEVGEEKGFNLVTVTPNRPAAVEFKPIPCQKPLLKVETDSTLENLEAYRDHQGFLKVIVKLESPQIGLANKVRKICPQALVVEAQYTMLPPEASVPQITEQFDAVDAFQRYWQQRVRTPLPSNVLETFTTLYKELRDASD